MKIAFLTPQFWPDAFGGELLLSIERFTSLTERGHKVDALTMGRNNSPGRIRAVNSPQIRWGSCLAKRINKIIYYLWLFWRVGYQKYDVIHIGHFDIHRPAIRFLIKYLLVKLVHIRKCRAVYVYSIADAPETAFVLKGTSALTKRLFLTDLDALVSVSPAIFQAQKKVLAASNLRLSLNRVNEQFFTPADAETRTEVRANLGIADDNVVFVFLGSARYRKGFDLLAEAFSDLSRQNPDWKLLVIGPRTREENAKLANQEMANALSCLDKNPSVYLLGRVDDRGLIARYLSASDVFVFPTRNEGMPLAPMEAMAAGLPVIITCLPGITDQVNIHQRTGIYIRPGDVAELKQAMTILGNDASLRIEYGQQARNRIVNDFGWQDYIDEWEVIYGSR